MPKKQCPTFSTSSSWLLISTPQRVQSLSRAPPIRQRTARVAVLRVFATARPLWVLIFSKTLLIFTLAGTATPAKACYSCTEAVPQSSSGNKHQLHFPGCRCSNAIRFTVSEENCFLTLFWSPLCLQSHTVSPGHADTGGRRLVVPSARSAQFPAAVQGVCGEHQQQELLLRHWWLCPSASHLCRQL